ncbi:hypothetical protein CTAYLR_004308 [Chrysophaeum taylorii]|uniref:Histone-lysine N-methyltransferase n=1 Tax=Chrysophaeum taylorii TaxID=2483200 RepID=A0AAD7UHL3_9STRA|nr:hypothetical protein CTAYLR_004308 [Chrysophaeum taylorii]
MPRGGRRQCAVTEEDAAAEARRMVDSYVYVKQGALYEEEEEEVVKEEEEEDVCEEKCLKAAYRAIWQPPRQRQRKRRRALRLPAIEFCEVDFELPPEVYAEVVENREAEAARSGGNREPEVAMREFELVRRNVVEERSRSGEVTGKCGCGPESLCREGGCPNRAAFIECAPETCDLGKACQNRRLQRCRGAARGLEVRPAGPKGLGLFAARHYEPGDLVGEYLGEVMDSAKYASLARSRRERHCYFMRLGDHVIDASRKGGLCRFLNHSCAPNAEAERWSVNGDRRVAITVVTPIAPGDEITIDYDWKGAEDGRPCHCGAPTCRGLMASEFNNVEEEEEEEEEEQQQDRPHSWEALAEMLHAWNNPRSFVLEVQSQPDDGTTPEEEEEEEEEEETPDECGVEEDDNDDDTTPEEEEEDEEAFCPRRSLRLKAAAAARERPYLPHREDSPEEETDDEDSREQTGESPEEETEESHQKDARPKAVDPRRRRAALVVREELSETSSSEETSDQAPRVSDDVSPVAEDSLPAANDAAFAPPPPVIKPTKAVLDAAKRRADYLRRANVTLPEPVAPAAPPVDNDDVVLEPQARQLLAALPASYVEKIKARIRDGEIKNPCSYIVRAERKVRDLAARAREEVPPLEDDEAFSRLDLAAKRTLASLPPEDIQDIKHKLQNGEIRYPKSYIIRAARRLRAKFDALEPPPAEPDDDDNDLVISDLLDPRASAALASMPEKTAGKIKRKLRDGGIRDPRSYILKVRGNAEVLEAVREQEKAALLEVPEDENHLDGDDPGKVDDDPLAGLDDEVKEALAELPANYQEKIQRKMREGKVRTPTSYILNIRRTYRRESDESSPRDGRGAAAFDDDDDDDFASLDAETKDALFSFPQNDIQSIRRKHRKGEIHVLKNYIIQAYRNFQERLKTDRILSLRQSRPESRRLLQPVVASSSSSAAPVSRRRRASRRR